MILGFGLVIWVVVVYGDDVGVLWGDLVDNIVIVIFGWFEVYGLFLEGEVDVVLFYIILFVYYLIVEEDVLKIVWVFDEGYYM